MTTRRRIPFVTIAATVCVVFTIGLFAYAHFTVEERVSQLLAGLQSSKVSDRRATAFLVRTYQAVDPRIVEQLRVALNDSDSRVRFFAAQSLIDVLPRVPEVEQSIREEAVSTLVELMGDDDWEIRAVAAQFVGDANAFTDESVRALEKLLSDRFTRVRKTAAESLARGGKLASTAIP